MLLKGKPWSVEEEKQLREMFLAHRPLGVIVGSLGKTKESIRCKIARMHLVDDNHLKSQRLSSSKVLSSTQKLTSEELPSVEEALQKINNALDLLESPGLDQAETLRLRSIIQGRKMYIEKLAEYMDYRGLEVEMLEWREKYADLVKKTSNVAPK